MIAYGTAGFRDKAVKLPTVVERVGMLAALRSRYLGGKFVGVMITASHNPPEDNGAKIVEPMGEMLEQSWEKYATELANSANPEETLDKLYEYFNISKSSNAYVVIGRDTRASGPSLIEKLRSGLGRHTTIVDLGEVTTPQLHYIVRAKNTEKDHVPFGEPTLQGYYKKHANAFSQIVHDRESVVVDCANGVGAPRLKELAKILNLDIEIVNSSNDPQALNVGCGADYVKTGQKLPNGVNPVPSKLYASFDGDADRVVFYYVDDSSKFHLLDGDKIATLAAVFLKERLPKGTDLGVVQTAYANGASTAYLTSQGIPVVCQPTGVKHLHHAAVKFDVGVYFEANGHGTVVFKPEFIDKLRGDHSAALIVALNDLINQAVGDAISDLLMVIAILAIRQWTPAQWNACYTDLPNTLLKANVKDRTMFTTTDAERKLVTPEGLQGKLDDLMKKYKGARTFVRASGTEDVVRIYAEAERPEDVRSLGEQVKELVGEFA